MMLSFPNQVVLVLIFYFMNIALFYIIVNKKKHRKKRCFFNHLAFLALGFLGFSSAVSAAFGLAARGFLAFGAASTGVSVVVAGASAVTTTGATSTRFGFLSLIAHSASLNLCNPTQ
jgi:uncharacterized membrane protein